MIQLTAQPRRITPDDGHWFFGYYDIPAFDAQEKRHLAIRTDFMDRMQQGGDEARIYTIDLETGARDQIGATTAWNFQQACFIQWVPALPDTVLYNVRRADTACGYGAILKNLRTGEEKQLDRPAACVSPNGRYSVSINFDRLFDFRPGYGYAGQPDKWLNDNHPADDGIFLTDFETGTSRLILSLEQLWDFTKSYFGGDQKICVNHINFNTDGSRFVFLLRNFGRPWRTAILTADYDGKNLYLLSDYAYASHYHWKSRDVLCIHSSGLELGDLGNQLYELTDLTHEGRAIDPDFFKADGHISYSPDREWILYDSYPLPDGCRELYLYSLKTRRGGLLGRFAVVPFLLDPKVVDMRCDLHPVWAPSGNQISFDSVHEGFRGIYTIDLNQAKRELLG